MLKGGYACCNLSIPGTLAEASPDEVRMIGSQMCLHVADALQAMQTWREAERVIILLFHVNGFISKL